MARRKRTTAQRPIKSREHRDKQRVSNPPVELVTPETDRDAGTKKRYADDPDLDLQLVGAGKTGHTPFEVPTAAFHGSVRLEAMDGRPRRVLAARDGAWEDPSRPAVPRRQATGTCKRAVERAYAKGREGFDSMPFMAAFQPACRGHDDHLPIRCPRATAKGRRGPPPPEGESFARFIANEGNGARFALRDLARTAGLPSLREPSGPGGGGRSRGPQGGGGRSRHRRNRRSTGRGP